MCVYLLTGKILSYYLWKFWCEEMMKGHILLILNIFQRWEECKLLALPWALLNNPNPFMTVWMIPSQLQQPYRNHHQEFYNEDLGREWISKSPNTPIYQHAFDLIRYTVIMTIICWQWMMIHCALGIHMAFSNLRGEKCACVSKNTRERAADWLRPEKVWRNSQQESVWKIFWFWWTQGWD